MSSPALVFSFLLLSCFSFVFCDPYDDQITSLPGWGTVNGTQFSGFLPINNGTNSKLFYWFIERQDATTAPTVVWINGGRGYSSLIGAFGGIGPYLLHQEENDTITLLSNPYSWTNASNLLFIDQPVGTGYSTAIPSALATNETQIKEQLYAALCSFFALHTDYTPTAANPLFIASNGYGGKYVPPIASRIAEGGDYMADNTPETCLDLYLGGIIIGNGFIDPYWQLTASPEQAYANGYVGTHQYEQGESLSKSCQSALLLGDTNIPNNGTHPCEVIDEFIHSAAGNFSNYDEEFADPFPYTLLTKYMNLESVKESLHVENSTIEGGESKISFSVYNHEVKLALLNDTYISQMNTIATLLNTVQIKILVYSGQFDMEMSTLSTVRWLRAMNWGGKSIFSMAPRLQWIPEDDGEIGGFIQSSLGLYFLTIVNSGHWVAMDQPKLTFRMLETFIDNKAFAVDTDELFSNHLCSFFNNCGDNGYCTQGYCICNNGFTGLDCSIPIQPIFNNVNSTEFIGNSTLPPLVWDYFSFEATEPTDLLIWLDSALDYRLYMRLGSPPDMEHFDVLFSLGGATQQLITNISKGSWYFGVFNNADAFGFYQVKISRNQTFFLPFDDSSSHYTTSKDDYFVSFDVEDEKSLLVWAIFSLSLLLFLCMLIIFFLFMVIIKKVKNTTSHIKMQTWQDDDL